MHEKLDFGHELSLNKIVHFLLFKNSERSHLLRKKVLAYADLPVGSVSDLLPESVFLKNFLGPIQHLLSLLTFHCVHMLSKGVLLLFFLSLTVFVKFWRDLLSDYLLRLRIHSPRLATK